MNEFADLAVIGRGSYAIAYRAVHTPTGQTVVLKRITVCSCLDGVIHPKSLILKKHTTTTARQDV